MCIRNSNKNYVLVEFQRMRKKRISHFFDKNVKFNVSTYSTLEHLLQKNRDDENFKNFSNSCRRLQYGFIQYLTKTKMQFFGNNFLASIQHFCDYHRAFGTSWGLISRNEFSRFRGILANFREVWSFFDPGWSWWGLLKYQGAQFIAEF